jgi:hypothetical protein
VGTADSLLILNARLFQIQVFSDNEEGAINGFGMNRPNVQRDQANAHEHNSNKQRIKHHHNAKGRKNRFTTNEIVSDHKKQ